MSHNNPHRTYEITQLVEMTITHRVRATDAETANDEATRRTMRTCGCLASSRSNIGFGDVQVDYVPAVDQPEQSI